MVRNVLWETFTCDTLIQRVVSSVLSEPAVDEILTTRARDRHAARDENWKEKRKRLSTINSSKSGRKESAATTRCVRDTCVPLWFIRGARGLPAGRSDSPHSFRRAFFSWLRLKTTAARVHSQAGLSPLLSRYRDLRLGQLTSCILVRRGQDLEPVRRRH